MRIAIAGAGAVGRSVAQELVGYGHKVLLIEKEVARYEPSTVPGADWFLADACEVSSLEEAEVHICDVAIAATGDDKSNLTMAFLAKTEFGIDRVVARINDSRNEWLFTEAWGIDVAVSTPIGARRRGRGSDRRRSRHPPDGPRQGLARRGRDRHGERREVHPARRQPVGGPARARSRDAEGQRAGDADAGHPPDHPGARRRPAGRRRDALHFRVRRRGADQGAGRGHPPPRPDARRQPPRRLGRLQSQSG